MPNVRNGSLHFSHWWKQMFFWKDWPPICRAGEKAERPVIVGILEYLRGADLWFLTKACHTFVLDHWLSLFRGRSSACSFNAAALLDLLALTELEVSRWINQQKLMVANIKSVPHRHRKHERGHSPQFHHFWPRWGVCGSNMHFSSCASLECSIKTIQNDNENRYQPQDTWRDAVKSSDLTIRNKLHR